MTRIPVWMLAAGLVAAVAVGCSDEGAEPPAFPGYVYASHYVDLPAGRMHYVDEGAGDPVVLLHGVPVWSYVWRNVLPFIAEGHRVLAPDMLNHGKSDKAEGYGAGRARGGPGDLRQDPEQLRESRIPHAAR